MAISKNSAKKYSIMKWEYYLNTGKEFLSQHIIVVLKDFECYCGMCEYYKYSSCEECYLCKEGICTTEDSCAYNKWDEAKTIKTRKKYAKIILDAVRVW